MSNSIYLNHEGARNTLPGFYINLDMLVPKHKTPDKDANYLFKLASVIVAKKGIITPADLDTCPEKQSKVFASPQQLPASEIILLRDMREFFASVDEERDVPAHVRASTHFLFRGVVQVLTPGYFFSPEAWLLYQIAYQPFFEATEYYD